VTDCFQDAGEQNEPRRAIDEEFVGRVIADGEFVDCEETIGKNETYFRLSYWERLTRDCRKQKIVLDA